LVAGLIGFILWKASHAPSKETASGPVSTNSFDATRATNLLRWLGTNFVEKTNPPAAPAPILTNRPSTNVVSRPAPIIVITNKPVEAVTSPPPSKALTAESRPVKNILEAQIAMARRVISSGPIDGVMGYQTRAALRAFQKQVGISETGDLDAATKNALVIE
jgi:peptidoglycan hydrolase-like protein with peptidoglycan-binding domain